MTLPHISFWTRTILVATMLTAVAMVPAWSQEATQAFPAKVSDAQPDTSKRTAKQKELDDQVERLASMAAELKVEVDKTNKNILSLQVVRKAEEIEALAHRLKDQGKRP